MLRLRKFTPFGLTGLLVIATYLLVIATTHHAEEAGIDRKIAFKEKRLEKLYTPILNDKELITNPTNHPNEALKFLNELQRFTHLAHDDVKKELEDHLREAVELVRDVKTVARLAKTEIPIDSRKDKIKESGEKLLREIEEKAEEDRNRLKELRP